MNTATQVVNLNFSTSVRSRAEPALPLNEIAVVIPVYQGEKTLPQLLREIEVLTEIGRTPKGFPFKISEVILVNDGAVDNSQEVMEELALKYSFVRVIFLSRNFGQHAATLAGIASTVSQWIVTLDEDGQQNPEDIGLLLETALTENSQLVYGDPENRLPHGWLRNQSSKLSKRIFSLITGDKHFNRFNSFRLIRGEVARSLAAYCGNSVYLDGALSWVSSSPAYRSVKLRAEGERPSGYNYFKLIDDFMRLVFTSRKTPLRLVSCLGFFSVVASFGFATYVLWLKAIGHVPVQGWASMVILISFFSGMILFSIGIVAEYLGLVLTMSMGRPLYLIVSPPTSSKKQVGK